MASESVKVFCRIRPSKSKEKLAYDVSTSNDKRAIVRFYPLRNSSDIYTSNRKEVHTFRFSGLFDQDSCQEQVFSLAGLPVVESALSGFNGTIFAYGQTGSGKTYTITGGPQSYQDRGLIPRCLSHIFDHFKADLGLELSLCISYFEIYNENGYDLLNPDSEFSSLDSLPSLVLMEDRDGTIHLRNLSIHRADSEDQALSLLFLGETNRAVAETPMNQASSRSHCIFTMHISTRDRKSGLVRSSKLHLVDLAGSERILKTGIHGLQLTEAKHINLSLHYLEQVIVALSEKARSHVPYRNSLMTYVLRDSLGGNCKTTMITTCSLETSSFDETISSCRFSQRVAMIQNEVFVNEEVDPRKVIEKLEEEVAELKARLESSSAVHSATQLPLSSEEKESLLEASRQYVSDPDYIPNFGKDARKYAFLISTCKSLLVGHLHSSLQGPTSSPSPHPDYSKLKETLIQRDNEINILVNLLRKEREKSKNTSQEVFNPGPTNTVSVFLSSSDLRAPNSEIGQAPPSSPTLPGDEFYTAAAGLLQAGQSLVTPCGPAPVHSTINADRLSQPSTLDLPTNFSELRLLLKERLLEAKSVGKQVAETKRIIEQMKTKMDACVLEKGSSLEADSIRQTIAMEKSKYKGDTDRLRALKKEVDHLQHLLSTGNIRSAVSSLERQQSSNDGHKQAEPTSTRCATNPSVGPNSETQVPSRSPGKNLSGSIHLTGDPFVDENIQAFLESRRRIRERLQ